MKAELVRIGETEIAPELAREIEALLIQGGDVGALRDMLQRHAADGRRIANSGGFLPAGRREREDMIRRTRSESIREKLRGACVKGTGAKLTKHEARLLYDALYSVDIE